MKYPINLIYVCTYRCNMHCKHCMLYDKINSSYDEIHSDDFEYVIRSIKHAGIRRISFTGGEPLLFKDIDKFAKLCQENNIKTDLSTNGLLLVKKFDILKYFDSISVSLEIGKEINDEIRGKGNYDKVLKNIKFCIDNGIDIRVNSVVFKNSIKSLQSFLELSTKAGFKCHFGFYDYNETYVKELIPSPDENLSFFEQLLKYKKSYFNICTDTAIIKYYIKIKGNIKNHKIRCSSGSLSCFMFPNGDIQNCYYHLTEHNNIKHYGFKECFNYLPKMIDCNKCIFNCWMKSNLLFNLHLPLIKEIFIASIKKKLNKKLNKK